VDASAPGRGKAHIVDSFSSPQRWLARKRGDTEMAGWMLARTTLSHRRACKTYQRVSDRELARAMMFIDKARSGLRHFHVGLVNGTSLGPSCQNWRPGFAGACGRHRGLREPRASYGDARWRRPTREGRSGGRIALHVESEKSGGVAEDDRNLVGRGRRVTHSRDLDVCVWNF
jgi:hypothetical protein